MEKLINNNSKLIISHIGDIDGMGSVILALIAFKKIDYLLIEVNEQREALDFIKKHHYEQIYICDIPLENNIADELYELNLPLLHFDHHETNIYANKYAFSRVLVSVNNHLTCGSELFYLYLTENKLLIGNETLNEFVKIIRCRDTWIYEDNKEDCDALSNLFSIMGPNDFISHFYHYLPGINSYCMPKEDSIMLTYRQKEINEIITKANKQMIKIKFDNYLAGLVFSNNFQSEIGSSLCTSHSEIDLCIIINMLDNKVSLRSKTIDVSKIALKRNGGGHKYAAGYILTKNYLNELLELIINS